MSSSLVLLLIMSVLQIWVCCDYSCQAGAIRIFPGSHGSIDKKSKVELFHKYFSGRTFALNRTHDNGFEESKRKVPSCPDPLHNQLLAFFFFSSSSSSSFIFFLFDFVLNLISKIPSFFSSILCKYFDGFVVYGGKPGVFWNLNSFLSNVRSKKMDDHDVYRNGELQFYSFLYIAGISVCTLLRSFLVLASLLRTRKVAEM